jgi:hypothetical protein
MNGVNTLCEELLGALTCLARDLTPHQQGIISSANSHEQLRSDGHQLTVLCCIVFNSTGTDLRCAALSSI